MPALSISGCTQEEFLRYYKCPEVFAEFQLGELPTNAANGYFSFGPDLICYGKTTVETRKDAGGPLCDALAETVYRREATLLPFDPREIATNLRLEKYVGNEKASLANRLVHQLYYLARPALPVGVRRHLQRRRLRGWATHAFPQWPVDTTVDRLFAELMRLQLRTHPETRIPFIWFWPDHKKSCAIMTHDVETAAGLDFTENLMNVNDSYGIKSSFQLIPDARYTVTAPIRNAFRERGFEVNVHDLKHDGHLFDDAAKFAESARRINRYGKEFGSAGFRTGALYRNQEWFSALHFAYDMSVPNCAHLDPQPGGCCTVMPYFIDELLELPVTTTQDYSLFHIIGTYSLDLWQQQMNRIMQHHGMMSFIVHPDYLTGGNAMGAYESLLAHLDSLRQTAALWIALPGEVNTWWRQRDAMQLVPGATGNWRIAGAGAERARVAYASLQDDRLSFRFS